MLPFLHIRHLIVFTKPREFLLELTSDHGHGPGPGSGAVLFWSTRAILMFFSSDLTSLSVEFFISTRELENREHLQAVLILDSFN